MINVDDVRARVVLVFALMACGGCAVGSVVVRAPERLPSKDLAPLTQPVRFDICGVSPQGSKREDEGARIRKALWRVGVPAELTPIAGSPADFTVTLGSDGEPELGWTFVASFVTGSILPGYAVKRTTLDVDLTWRDAEQVRMAEHLRYQVRTTYVVWLPLIIVPDFLWSLSGVWESPELEDNGFRQMFGRLGDDIRSRVVTEVAESDRSKGGGMVCTRRAPPGGAIPLSGLQIR
jgi:hypothetical protein